MIQEYIKIFAPFVVIYMWLIFAARAKNYSVAMSGLYFTSYAVFSSNFSLIYREMHQAIQIFIIISFLFLTFSRRKILHINNVILVFLGLIIISIIENKFDADANAQLQNFIVCSFVANYLLLVNHDEHHLTKIADFFANTAIVLAAIGLVEFYFGSVPRIEVTFSNPNYYGLYLGIGSCIVLATWHGLKRNIATIVILLALILSGSRSAMAFPVLQAGWMLFQGKKVTKVMPFFTLVFVAILVVSYSGVTRYTDLSSMEGSDTERKIFATIALRMANDHPLTGVGWGRFVSEFAGYSSRAEKIKIATGDIDISEQERRVTHNDYMRILAELGWIAFAASVFFSLYSLKILFKYDGFGLIYMVPVFSGLLFFSLGHNNMNSAFFWFFCLLPYYLSMRQTRESRIGMP